MAPFLFGFLLLIVLLLLFYWKGRIVRRSVAELFEELKTELGLENAVIKRIPTPTLSGKYFGYPFFLVGKGYHFSGTIELPHPLSERIFIQHEDLKTKLKPILGLKLVLLPDENLHRHFLLLGTSTKELETVFQPYLCQKLLLLKDVLFRIDIHDAEAHLEIWHQEDHSLADFFKILIEILNVLQVRFTR